MSGKIDLREILVREAELFEEQKDVRKKGGYVRPLPPRAPSQIYTVRVPVDRVEELRRLADSKGLRPSALARQWILDKLDEESQAEMREPSRFRASLLGVRRDVDRLITALEPEKPKPKKRSKASASKQNKRSSKVRRPKRSATGS